MNDNEFLQEFGGDYEGGSLESAILIASEEENDNYYINKCIKESIERGNKITAEKFKIKYLPKFHHIVDNEDGLDVDMYYYKISNYTGINYYHRRNEFYYTDYDLFNSQRKLVIENVMTLIDIFEKIKE